MEFDYVVGNPPYSVPISEKKTKNVWSELTVKFFNLVKENGTLSIIHPAGWRFLSPGSRKDIKKIYEIYTTNRILYMEFNDIVKGKKTFKACTDYDVITVKKELYEGQTLVRTKSGLVKINLKDYNVIPTDRIDIFDSLRYYEED